MKIGEVMPIKNNPKIFVLDTNVILHDHNAIFNFQENDIYIPITVIEELDKFKKGNSSLNYNAREFLRDLDRLIGNSTTENGFVIGKNKGILRLIVGHTYPDVIKLSLFDDIPDHRIIATTYWLKEQNPTKKVILVSKDINLRLKSKAIGVMAQDYLTDKIGEEKIEQTKREITYIRKISQQRRDKIENSPNGITLKDFGIRKTPLPNQLYKINKGDTSIGEEEYILGRYDDQQRAIVKVQSQSAYGITPRNHEQIFAMDAVLNPKIKLISLTGTAGTGKTLIALAGALAQADQYDQILLSRPVIPLQYQEMGFLPGSVSDKLSPYMLPLFDNLNVIKQNFKTSSKEVIKIEDMLRREQLLINPLAYIRGRSLSNVFFIVDESQNLTPHEIKTIITRAGENTKIVFTGDIYQIDQPYLDMNSNGLSHLGEKFYGERIFEHVNLVKGERSELSELAGKLL